MANQSLGMQRLVYTPRAYVFIKDKTGTIYNISRYVMSGTVSRKIDQVSSAEIVVRNTEKLFSVHTDATGAVVQPLFSPMDPITIYLRRAKDHPVRVFTGFLDSTPYLQLFPGPAKITASCTLKRLQNTYFDPALPYTQSFFNAYGWIQTSSGQWLSPTANANPDAAQDAEVGKNAKKIYVNGDSLAVGTTTGLKKELTGVTVESDAKNGRQTTHGVDILEARAKKGDLPDVVVLSLGTNDTSATVFAAQVERVMKDVVASTTHVIWPNISRPNMTGFASQAKMNKVLADAKAKYPNLTIIDWAGKVDSGSIKLGNDKMHTSAQGYSARAALLGDAVKAGGGTATPTTKAEQQAIDGSLSMLLMATLGHIGHWNPNDIYIEQLPSDLFERMRDMADEFSDDNAAAYKAFQDFLKKMIGSGSYGNANGGSSGGTGSSSGATGEVQGIENVIPVLKRNAEAAGIDPVFVIAVCDMESGFRGTVSSPSGQHHGWFQQQTAAAPYGNAGINEIPSLKDTQDLGKSSILYCKAANARKKKFPGIEKDTYSWYMVTQGMMTAPGGGVIGSSNTRVAPIWQAKIAHAKELLSKYGDGGSDTTSSNGATGKSDPADSGPIRATGSSSGEQVFTPVKGMPVEGWPGPQGSYGAPRSYGSHRGVDSPSTNGAPWYSITDGQVAAIIPNWANGQPAVVIKSSQKFDGYPSPLYIGYGSLQSVKVKAGQTVSGGQEIGLGGTHGSGPHLHFFLADNAGAGNGTMDPTKFLRAAAAGKTPTGGGTQGTPETVESGGEEFGYPLESQASIGADPDAHEAAGRGGSWYNRGWDLMTPVGTKALSPCDGKITRAHQGTPDSITEGWQISITSKSGKKFFMNLHGDGVFKAAEGSIKRGDLIGLTGDTNGPHLHFSSEDETLGAKIVKLDPGSTTQSGNGSSDSSAGAGGADAVSAATAGTFFGTLQMPSIEEAYAARMLTGEKSLLNDKPLLPFIQQLTNATMRHFQSLPDGRFYAFYPDYFGEYNHHAPYWEIDDIEILDGKVDLSDESLVTHMYVVGDTLQPMTGGSDFPLRAVFSSGVVTIFNAFMADSMLDRDTARVQNSDAARSEVAEKAKNAKAASADDYIPSDPKKARGMQLLLDRSEAAAFLDRYGARPVVEDMPMIRNTYYEMFLAFQKFMLGWSRQFLTPFSFTFMPELYPGGKVGFPDHNLQMYIEEVTHSWSYTDGFTTDAAMSAPSVYGAGTGKELLPPNMARAIIEPAAASVQAAKVAREEENKTKPKKNKGV